jgi:hypothetical protein
MWKYGVNPSEEQVEEIMKYVESLFVKVGACPTDINKENRKKFGQRVTYIYKDEYYRVDRIPFDNKPFVVIEWTDEEQAAKVGVMWDVEPFPYDLPLEKIEKEVLFAFGIEPYPESYPNY